MNLNLFGDIATYDESSVDDINELYEFYKRCKKTINFSLGNKPKLESKQLEKEIMSILTVSRSICLINLSHSDDFQFFDCPSLNEMYETAFKPPPVSSKHFKLAVSQSLTNVINNIHTDHKKFSHLVVEYFGVDISLHTLFGLSTFPAIYGFFCTQKMCKNGAELLLDFIGEPEQEHLVDAMLTSYFDCAFPFFTNLFEKFVLLIGNEEFNPSLSNVLSALTTSVSYALPLLTRYHIDLIRAYNSISHERFASFLGRLLKSNYLRYTVNEFIPNQVRLLCTKLFTTIGSDVSIAEILYAHLTNVKLITFATPESPTTEQLPKMPLVLSDRDVLIILEIMKDLPDLVEPLQKLANENTTLFKNGYAPFTFDLHFPIKSDPSPHANATNDIVVKYRKLRQKLENECIEPLEYVRSHSSKFSSDFLLYVHRYEISAFKCNLIMMNRYFSITEKIDLFKSYKDCALHVRNKCIYEHARILMQPFLHKEKNCSNESELDKLFARTGAIISDSNYPFNLLVKPIISTSLSKWRVNLTEMPKNLPKLAADTIRAMRKKPEFVSIKPIGQLVAIAKKMLFVSLNEKKYTYGTLSNFLDLILGYSELVREAPAQQNSALLFYRVLFPDDSKSCEVTMIGCARIIYMFMILRKVITYIRPDFDITEMIVAFANAENFILYPLSCNAELIKILSQI